MEFLIDEADTPKRGYLIAQDDADRVALMNIAGILGISTNVVPHVFEENPINPGQWSLELIQNVDQPKTTEEK